MKNNTTNNSYFISFKTKIDKTSIPEIFPDPYNHTPHPLCIKATTELQHYIEDQKDWHHDFDINNLKEETNLGKMFGVLLVQDDQEEIGYLAAFSGLIDGKDTWPNFVPPVTDMFREKSFFRNGEKKIDLISEEINNIETSSEYQDIILKLNTAQSDYLQKLDELKRNLKKKKNQRKLRRQKEISLLDEGDYINLKNELENQSRMDKFDYRKVKEALSQTINSLQNEIYSYENIIHNLKVQRKEKSRLLQQEIFNKYQFVNISNEVKSANDIFKDTAQKIPPSGAGDCAAPKLLQYALKHNLKPLALAEFWWGQSPSSVIRKHGYYYSPCKGKCEPILKHMLKGITLEKKSLLKISSELLKIETIYEDNVLLIINKPSGLLSVSGKISEDSVYKRMKDSYPQASGPLIVHRLDMFTSGLMIITKTISAYKNIQKQFSEDTIKKEYIALVDGILDRQEGIIDLPLIEDYNERPKQCVSYDQGKKALTHWKIIEAPYGKNKNYSKVLFVPKTGRTHQLRVHAAHHKGLNTSIVGDNLYGLPGERLCLHARKIEFIHPLTMKVISFTQNEDF